MFNKVNLKVPLTYKPSSPRPPTVGHCSAMANELWTSWQVAPHPIAVKEKEYGSQVHHVCSVCVTMVN